MNAPKLSLCFTILALTATAAAATDEAEKSNAALEKKLDSLRLTLNFDSTPARDALQFLQDITRVSVSVDPKAKLDELRVSCVVQSASLRKALDLITKQCGLDYKASRGVLLIGAPESIKRYPDDARSWAEAEKARSPLDKRLDSQRISLNFKSTPARAVFRFLQDITGLSVFVDPGTKLDELRVSCALKNVSLRKALDLIAKQGGLDYKASCGVLLIGAPQAVKRYPADAPSWDKARGADLDALKAASRTMDTTLRDMTTADVLSFVRQLSGVECNAGAGFRLDRPLSLVVTKLSVLRILTLLAHSQGGELKLDRGGFILAGPEAK